MQIRAIDKIRQGKNCPDRYFLHAEASLLFPKISRTGQEKYSCKIPHASANARLTSPGLGERSA